MSETSSFGLQTYRCKGLKSLHLRSDHEGDAHTLMSLLQSLHGLQTLYAPKRFIQKLGEALLLLDEGGAAASGGGGGGGAAAGGGKGPAAATSTTAAAPVRGAGATASAAAMAATVRSPAAAGG